MSIQLYWSLHKRNMLILLRKEHIAKLCYFRTIGEQSNNI